MTAIITYAKVWITEDNRKNTVPTFMKLSERVSEEPV